MATAYKLIIGLGLFVFVSSKKLNFEEFDLEETNIKARDFMNLFNDEETNLRNERYARHVQSVTESMLDHVINEIRHEYIRKNYNPNSPIRRLIRTLNGEMQKNQRTKLKKEKQDKKMAKEKKKRMAKQKKKKVPKKKKRKPAKKGKKVTTKSPNKYNTPRFSSEVKKEETED